MTKSLQKKAEDLGLQLIECMPWHWQIRGGDNIVNYYPTKRTIFVNGTKGGISGGLDDALKLARSAPKKIGEKVERRSSAYYKRIKMALLSKDASCHWCNCHLTAKTATVDHRIPLKRGGSGCIKIDRERSN